MPRTLPRRALLAATMLLPAALPAWAQDASSGGGTPPTAAAPSAGTRYVVGDLVLTAPWSRPALAGGTGAGFVTIRNGGTAADRLVAAETTAARAVEIHESSMDNGVMRMRPLPAVEVAPGATVALAPGGLHLMLADLTAALRSGDRIPVTLHFARSGAVHLDFVVQAAAPGGHSH